MLPPFLLIIDLHFLIAAVIANIFNPTAKPVIPIRIPTKEAKSKIETYPAIVEAKIRNCSIKRGFVQTFLGFLLPIQCPLLLDQNNFLFHLNFSI